MFEPRQDIAFERVVDGVVLVVDFEPAVDGVALSHFTIVMLSYIVLYVFQNAFPFVALHFICADFVVFDRGPVGFEVLLVVLLVLCLFGPGASRVERVFAGDVGGAAAVRRDLHGVFPGVVAGVPVVVAVGVVAREGAPPYPVPVRPVLFCVVPRRPGPGGVVAGHGRGGVQQPSLGLAGCRVPPHIDAFGAGFGSDLGVPPRVPPPDPGGVRRDVESPVLPGAPGQRVSRPLVERGDPCHFGVADQRSYSLVFTSVPHNRSMT